MEQRASSGAKCQCCGNFYDKTLTITRGQTSYVFDCFECAIHVLAPKCEHCGVQILGHGMEHDGRMFCCAYCAGQEGVINLRDRSDFGLATNQ